RKDDRYGRGRSLCRERRWVAGCDNDGHLSTDKVSGKSRQSFVMALGPVILDGGVLASDHTCFVQAAVKRTEDVCGIAKPPAAEETNHRHRVLRARRQRPRGRAAEQRDELAAVHVWLAPAWQEKM